MAAAGDATAQLGASGAGDAAVASGGATRPWVEKYRPKTVDEVAYQDEVISTLKNSIKTGNLPHLLFYGPPGTGKTSTILAAARELFGPEKWRERTRELNASDERGISVVRDSVKHFASTTVSTANGMPSFKLIILDEADSLTADAQAALRRTMETHAKVTRFCIICNYVSRIIDPLASRCAKFRFKPLSRESMKARLSSVAESEGVPVDDATLDALLDTSGGDLRKAIMYLQSAYQLYGDDMNAESVVEISGTFPDKAAASLWASIKGRGGHKAVSSSVRRVLQEGFPISSVLLKLLDTLAADDALSDLQKARMAEALAIMEKNLADRSDEELQLLHVCAKLQRIASGAQVQADEAWGY